MSKIVVQVKHKLYKIVCFKYMLYFNHSIISLVLIIGGGVKINLQELEQIF